MTGCVRRELAIDPSTSTTRTKKSPPDAGGTLARVTQHLLRIRELHAAASLITTGDDYSEAGPGPTSSPPVGD
jgi:hypothetical protein